MPWDFQVVGGGPNPFAPKQRTMTSKEILQVLELDPNRSMDHGRIRAHHQRLDSRRAMGGATDDQRLLEWALRVKPKTPELKTYDNPARLGDKQPSQRQLSPGDLELVRTLETVAPAAVSVDDVKLLAELEAVAGSPSERRVVSRVLSPIRRHHDRREEETNLSNDIARHTPSGWRCPVVRDAWMPVLVERLAEEHRAELEPQLAGLAHDVREKTLAAVAGDAEREAQSQLRELWGGLDATAKAQVDQARARLAALASGADPQSATPPSTGESAGVADGRRRGREAREAREAKADAFAGFRRIG